ncbi:bifunctional biotin--[acetyl-CoA-carboxylase] ligase/biotin operon repressor BirA, partial [Gammaproteobacteria bacterium]|nr:bifunctional biotin--[acetyl-CoA-carboxylase] ligase/biotin operon repressor BirA [Gammaproteobacteria bacterium]
MSQRLFPILKMLSNGKFHSGDELGAALGVSRAAIWKSIQKLTKFGLHVHSVRGKGYRLTQPLELLNQQKLLEELGQTQIDKIEEIELLLSIDSTNSHAMRRIQKEPIDLSQGKVLICLAEQQTGGKGRRGREWISPLGHNMYLSIAREFESGAVGLEGLSLVVGLALIRALKKSGIDGLSVKWPNDVLWGNRKLAGILLEMTGDVTGTCRVVIGLGLNIQVEAETMRGIDQPWVDVSSILSSLPGRNQLISCVINDLLLVLDEFEARGFESFMQEWDAVDAIKGCQVELLRSLKAESNNIVGIASGVNESGALLLTTPNGVLP